MKTLPWIMVPVLILTACAQATPPVQTLPPTVTVDSPASTESQPSAIPSAPPADFFTQNGITLPAPVCARLTQPQTEGPYYTPNTPERNTLYEEGMPGTRLLLVGYVLDQNCQPLANAKLDFWQADSTGEYDNVGYRLRGHQFTDAQGRFFLDTIFPGLYQSRPIEHIHVKIQPQGGAEVTSQVYFPQQPVDGLTAIIEERDGYLVGYFNFVVQKQN